MSEGHLVQITVTKGEGNSIDVTVSVDRDLGIAAYLDVCSDIFLCLRAQVPLVMASREQQEDICREMNEATRRGMN